LLRFNAEKKFRPLCDGASFEVASLTGQPSFVVLRCMHKCLIMTAT
jgi:hypothetical protein